MKNSLSYSGSFSDPDLEAMLEAEHQKLMRQARINGIHFAKQNRPHLKGDDLNFYTGDFVSRYNGLISLVLQRLQPDSCNAEAKMLISNAEEKTKECQQKRQAVQTQLHNLELEITQNGESLDSILSKEPAKGFSIVLAIIGATEVLLNVGALQLLGGNWLFSLVMSIGITGALFYLAKYLARYLKETSHGKQRKIAVIIGATILALGAFYQMAALRAEQIEEQAHYQVHPIFLVFINLLLYIVTVWHFYRSTIPSREKEQHERMSRIKDQLDSLKNQDTELEAEIKSIKEDLSQKLAALLYKPEYARRLTDRIKKWSLETVEIFKSNNLAQRPDRRAPDCFLSGKAGSDNYSSFTYLKD